MESIKHTSFFTKDQSNPCRRWCDYERRNLTSSLRRGDETELEEEQGV